MACLMIITHIQHRFMGIGILPRMKNIQAVFYLNDKAMYEVDSIEACEKAEVYKPSWEQEWTVYKWYAHVEGDETVIYANFRGKDPRKEKR